MFSPQSKKGKVASWDAQIAFVSSCLPRKCGIATFSTHLSQALEKNMGPDTASFIAMNNNGRYDYPSQVIDEIEQDNLNDYYKAARIINSSEVDVVSLQHEYGLFGGPDGIYIKLFLKHLEKPVVTTFHTVLKSPSPGQKKAFKGVAAYSQALVVMNKLAISFMTEDSLLSGAVTRIGMDGTGHDYICAGEETTSKIEAPNHLSSIEIILETS